ncbi:MAG: ArsR family transcriptional regulator [Rhodobacteraceae bacterium]|nr:MAG: ArsR family transcriptional regulator [Paracoccaceae bacterium]
MESQLTDQLAALSHPQRLGVFRLLVRRCPDALPAGDICKVLGLKASTASVYLSVLTRAGLITQTRVGTSRRYALNPDAARRMMADLFLDCCRGRPDLCPPLAGGEGRESPAVPDRKLNVLFICTGNSARSIFAEAILRDIAGERFNAYSAGTRPRSDLNPLAVEMLASKGLPTADLRAKPLSDFQRPDAPRPDFVFTVCDRAADEECPAWQGPPISAHWGLPDPGAAEGTEAERRLAFQHSYAMIWHRIRAFAALPLESLDRVALQRQVDDIGREQQPA